MVKRGVLFILAVLILATGCAPKAGLIDRPLGWDQKGDACWYGKEFHGRRTAGGEIFDMYKLTAAHLNLPFGTYVKVTNLKNGKSVVVKINDRGPFVKGRIIDVSYAAAKKLDMINDGVVPAVIEVVKK